jgi:CheY-like chemotaxis protein
MRESACGTHVADISKARLVFCAEHANIAEEAMTGRVLLASVSAVSRRRIEGWLQKMGFGVESVSTFEEARDRLPLRDPDVLISDVRLGEFNGLHLVIVGRARRPTLVAVVLGAPDPVLAKEAERLGATYLAEPVTEQELSSHVAMLLREAGRKRRWPRKHVGATVDVEVGSSLAHLVDLSYGGFRLEFVDAAGVRDPGSAFRAHVPAFGVSVDADLVWIERGSSGRSVWGAALANRDPMVSARWRQVVDRVGLSIQ